MSGLLATSFTVLALVAHATGAPDETTLSARAPTDEARVLVEDAAGAGDPSAALTALPGVALLHDGAPLAPARVAVRGLTGARTSATFGGIALADPLDGLFDVEALPWLAVRMAAADAAARTLRLEPDARDARLRARVVVGSLSTVRTGALAHVHTAHGRALVAVDAGLSRGDFAFAVPSPVDGEPPVFLVRDNADARRVSAAVLAHEHLGALAVDGAALASAHEGGVPGFATHPTDGLRARALLGGARLRAGTRDARAVAPSLELTARGSQRETNTALAASRDTVVAHQLGAVGRIDVDAGEVQARVGAHAERAGASVQGGAGRERTVGGGTSAASVELPAGAFPRVRAEADVRADVVSDVGPLFSGRVRVGAGEHVRVALEVRRTARAPTLDELYAPRGFVLGNPELGPEVLDDAELSVAARAGQVLTATGALWGGRIEDTILYLNRNAFEVAPENTGPAWRGGVDGGVRATPSPLVGVDVAFGTLWSRMDATGAPLPLAPALVARTGLRLGDADGAHVAMRTTSRTSASATLFGTLTVPGYTLVDLEASLPLGPSLAVGLHIKNALDQLDARDQNGLPLPGRLVFFSLEVTG